MKTLLPACLLLATAPVMILPASGETPRKIEDLYKSELEPFYHGVASGDPLPDGFIIWTRVTPRGKNGRGKVPVRWTVATDPGLRNVVISGNTLATGETDHTVKLDIRGLNPGQTYYYNFEAYGRESITGRTKTAPSTTVDQLKFAVVSCSNYEWGYFGGYRQISKRADLDAVIHVGDYIYEYADNDSYSSEEIRDERVLFPRGETIDLKQYRKRYATYRLDPNLRRAHKQHPFIAIWDDHEFANNAWRRGAKNHQSDEGSWRARKKAAKQAYFEWMPIRQRGGKIYRTLSYGPMMDLMLLDTRSYADKQIDDVTNSKLYDPERTRLGGKQKDWLKDELKNSAATWKIIGNQVVFSEFNIGFAADFDPIISPNVIESMFLDLWDGYPKERRELVKFLDRKKIDNTVILTGDIHCSFAFEVADPAADNPKYNPKTGKGAVAVEFVTPSLSAANFNEEISDFITDDIEEDINSPDGDGENPNPHMKYADLDQHGYLVLTVEEKKVQADYYFLKNVLKPRTKETWGAGFICRSGTNHLVPAKKPADAAPAPAALAPE